MRCKQCDYPLWNLRSRLCPECGAHFAPSEFEFVLNSVRFCCPHCNQDYYGTGEKGHLTPAEFDCISCGNHIHMDDTVLLPTEGVREEQTITDTMPWLDPRTSRFKGFFSTAFRALFEPPRLARAMPAEPAPLRALAFAVLCIALPFIVSGGALAVFTVIMLFAVPGGGGPGIFGGMLLGMLGMFAGAIVVILITLGIWIVSAHIILRLTGPVRGTIAHTTEPLCYGAAGNFVSAIPCFGFYISWAGWIWWSISSILMLRLRQEVSALRASIAVLAFPLLLILLIGLWIAFFVVPMMQQGMAAAQAAMAQQQQGMTLAATATQAPQIASALGAYRTREGDWPRHAIQLIAANDLFIQSLVMPGSTRDISDVPIGLMSLTDFQLLAPERERSFVQSAAASMPDDAVAHRLGDWVFTYHGLPTQNINRRLWLAIGHPHEDDLDETAGLEFNLIIIRADRSVHTIASGQFDMELDDQNELRESLGLPRIPDPRDVEDNKPATAEPR